MAIFKFAFYFLRFFVSCFFYSFHFKRKLIRFNFWLYVVNALNSQQIVCLVKNCDVGSDNVWLVCYNSTWLFIDKYFSFFVICLYLHNFILFKFLCTKFGLIIEILVFILRLFHTVNIKCMLTSTRWIEDKDIRSNEMCSGFIWCDCRAHISLYCLTVNKIQNWANLLLLSFLCIIVIKFWFCLHRCWLIFLCSE